MGAYCIRRCWNIREPKSYEENERTRCLSVVAHLGDKFECTDDVLLNIGEDCLNEFGNAFGGKLISTDSRLLTNGLQ